MPEASSSPTPSAATHLRRPPGSWVLALLVLLALVAGCGRDDAADRDRATSVAPASLAPGDPVPRPTGDPVLRITGGAATNRGQALILDRPTLERLGTQRISLDEPFKKRRMSFVAVPLRRIVQVAQPPAGATTLHSVALNDYTVDIPREVAEQDDVYLATRRGDGTAIPVADGGPIRVVFLDDAEHADVDNYWIWSLASVRLR